jgi:hypothetical protein
MVVSFAFLSSASPPGVSCTSTVLVSNPKETVPSTKSNRFTCALPEARTWSSTASNVSPPALSSAAAPVPKALVQSSAPIVTPTSALNWLMSTRRSVASSVTPGTPTNAA